MWQDQCYGMNCQARDDLSLWLQCIRPYGGSSTLSDAIRKAFLSSPKQIVIITDATFEIAPDLFYQVNYNYRTFVKRDICRFRIKLFY